MAAFLVGAAVGAAAVAGNNTESIILGGGCFWCLDALYAQVRGVIAVESGYAGGTTPSPSYDDVCSGKTGHAEVVKITYTPTIISLQTILELFWAVHDPTTLNRQGADVGMQYRSVVFYTNESQKMAITDTKIQMQSLWDEPIITEITELEAFYKAEDYHQDYFKNNPENAYCQIVINPKLAKFKQKFANLLA